MRTVRIVLALVALVLAALALLLAVDVGRWHTQIAAGDRTMAAHPAADIRWTPVDAPSVRSGAARWSVRATTSRCARRSATS